MLFDSGYLDEQAERYASTGYNILQELFFRVSEGFPRIIERDLPEGVGDLNYSVNAPVVLILPLTESPLKK